MNSIAPGRVDWIYRQVLAGADLRAAERFLDVRRARHVRAAHATWGVALGLHLRIGRRPRAIVIAPGLAYDARGRELFIPQERVLPLGDEQFTAGGLGVALRSAGDDAIPAADARIVSASDPLVAGRDVPLGTLAAGALFFDESERPHTRRTAPPRVRSGFVAAGGAAATVVGDHLEASIDTTAAGFEQTPVYLVEATLPPGALPARAIGPLVSIRSDVLVAPSPKSFVVQVRYVAPTAADLQQLPPLAPGGLPVSLIWVGFEPPPSFGVTAAPDPLCPRVI